MFTRRRARALKTTFSKTSKHPKRRGALAAIAGFLRGPRSRGSSRRRRLGHAIQIEPLEQRQLLTAVVHIDVLDGSSNAMEGSAEVLVVRVTATQLEPGQTVNVILTAPHPTPAYATEGLDYDGLPIVTIQYDPENPAPYEEFTITPLDDDIPEDVETVTIEIVDGAGYVGAGGGPGFGYFDSGAIQDDGDTPKVRITANDPNAAEAGQQTGQFTITLDTPAPAGGVIVAYTTSGTATGGDYALSGTSMIPEGGSSTVITVTPADDLVYDPSETVVLTVSPITGYGVGDQSSDTVSIADNDNPPPVQPTISISDASVSEGNDGLKNMTFMVTLSTASSQTVTVNYRTEDGDNADPFLNANQPSDYFEVTQSTLTFFPNVLSQQVNVQIKGDTDWEKDEQLRVLLLPNPANATIADGLGIGTITNDDLFATGSQTNPPDETHPCGCDTASMHNGGVRPAQPLGGGTTAIGNTKQNPHPIITVETTLTAGPLPTSFDVTLAFNGVSGQPKTLTADGITSGTDAVRFAMMADATGLPTGRYPWTMIVKSNFGSSHSSTREYSGTHFVVNRTDSPFGGGTWLDGMMQLVPITAGAQGVQVLRDNGDGLFWPRISDTQFDMPESEMDFVSLTRPSPTGRFTLTSKHGDKFEFEDTGDIRNRLSHTDRNGNITSYTWSGGKLVSKNNPYGQTTTLRYGTSGHESNKLTEVEDFAGAITRLTYSSEGKLATVTLPDPDGGGDSTPGLFDAFLAKFYLRDANTTGGADNSFLYGQPDSGVKPISGDWNSDGVDTVGVYHPASSYFLTNENAPGAADVSFQFGVAGLGWLPIAGDWNADNADTVGLYDPANSLFHFRNVHAGGAADISVQFGAVGTTYLPIAGDWNGDGVDSFGLYRPSDGTFLLKNSFAPGAADITVTLGGGLLPVAGDWNDDGFDTVGVYNSNNQQFQLSNMNGEAIVSFTFQGANSTWLPVVGDWKGQTVVQTRYEYFPSTGAACGLQ